MSNLKQLLTDWNEAMNKPLLTSINQFLFKDNPNSMNGNRKQAMPDCQNVSNNTPKMVCNHDVMSSHFDAMWRHFFDLSSQHESVASFSPGSGQHHNEGLQHFDEMWRHCNETWHHHNTVRRLLTVTMSLFIVMSRHFIKMWRHLVEIAHHFCSALLNLIEKRQKCDLIALDLLKV